MLACDQGSAPSSILTEFIFLPQQPACLVPDGSCIPFGVAVGCLDDWGTHADAQHLSRFEGASKEAEAAIAESPRSTATLSDQTLSVSFCVPEMWKQLTGRPEAAVPRGQGVEQSGEKVLGNVLWQRPLTHECRIGDLPDDMPAIVHRWPRHLRPGTGGTIRTECPGTPMHSY